MKTVVAIGAIRMLAIFGQLAFIKLMTYYLNPSQLGFFYFYVSVSYFINALLFVPFDYYQQSKVFKLIEKGCSLNCLVSVNVKIILLLVLISGLVGLFFRNTWGILLLVIPLSIILYLSTAIKNFLNNRGAQIFVVGVMLFELVVKLVVFLLFISNDKDGVTAAIAATVSSLAIGILTFSPRMYQSIRDLVGVEVNISMKEMINFCWPTSLGSVINWIQLQAYQVVLVPLGYSHVVGMYSTISNVGSTGMTTAATVYQQIYQPKIYQSSGQYLRTYLVWGGALIAFVFFVALLFKDLIIGLLTKEIFLRFSIVIGYGVLINACNFIIGALVINLSIQDKMKEQVNISLVALGAVFLGFSTLYYNESINVYTLGIPILGSQLVIAGYLLYKSGIFYAQT